MNFYRINILKFMRNRIFTKLTVILFLFVLVSCSDNSSKEKFHLYLLIGQSNMAGRGKVSEQDKKIDPHVFVLNKEDKWVPGADPIHFDKDIAGVGPGLSFGKSMVKRNPSVRIGLIPCAAGGSSIDIWLKDEYWSQTKSKPYSEAVRRTKIAMRDGMLKGILWHHGEGDCKEGLAEEYEEKLITLIEKLRNDLKMPDVPFVVGELGEFYVRRYPFAEEIKKALHGITRKVKNTACVSATGLTPKSDSTHFNAVSARELGRRYAEVMIDLIDKENE